MPEIEGHSGEIGKYVKEKERNKYGSDFLFRKGMNGSSLKKIPDKMKKSALM